MWEYTEKVKDFFLNPKNVGEIEKPDEMGYSIQLFDISQQSHLRFQYHPVPRPTV